MNTIVYYANTEPLMQEALFKKLLQELPAQRRELLSHYRAASDQALSMGAGLLLITAVRELLPNGPSVAAQLRSGALELAYGVHGKPYLPEYNRFQFSISHSGSMAVLAVSETEIGCDIEHIREADLRIADRFFSEREKALLGSSPSGKERTKLFFRLWTLRESFIKAVGKGLSLSMRDFAIVPEDADPSMQRMRVIQALDNRSYCFTEPFVAAGYQLAVCTVGECSNPSLRPIDFYTWTIS